ncbi:hypothetical protein MO767_22025 [Pseudomonas sp. UYIF39]|uniref:hypothetical protein n=1 Tax=Pseudomonas sp. UYIF39 TaxID=1630747 RepID=UPI00249DD55D|nr:hypothetical protein [Pseudomonas sp. UYIF39]MDI3357006.1 hypothetical protein [Pseudomonas sp. UYIF39]
MTSADQFWIVAFLVLAVVVITGYFVEQRRKRSLAEFEQRRRARKEEVERAARKAL